MNEKGKKLEPKLKLDMPFHEALARFAQTKAAEVAGSVDRSKEAVKPDAKKKQPQKGVDRIR
jgi:hypothetical protein